eukprot:scaffold53139_cov69-Phaeocystis_antarctica.AAC.4
MVKVAPWQRSSSAPAPPQGASGGSGQLGTPMKRIEALKGVAACSKCRLPVPQLAAWAAWDARLRIRAAPPIPEARLNRSDAGGSSWCGCQRVPTSDRQTDSQRNARRRFHRL